MKKFAGYFGSAALAVGLCASWNGRAAADQIVVTDLIPLESTDWNHDLSVLKFNPAQGTLQSVKIVLKGHVEGSAQYENTGASPALINLDLSSEIDLTRPDLTPLISVIPLVNVMENAAAYDGVFDSDGASGSTFPGLMGDDSDTQTYNSPADLALFTGIGNILLPTSATGASAASGAGNLFALFSTSAAASIEVTYTFASVPEPASCVLAGAALAGLIGFARRRKS